jgi:uncharacterized protein YndB with AHSA1/START domain
MKTFGRLHVEARGEREIYFTRLFDAPRTLVWEAHTKPEYVKRWLLGPGDWSMPVCEIDLKVGGRYRYVWRHADGREMGMGGVFREVTKPERLVTTELFDEDWTGGEAVNTTAFAEQVGGKTTLTTTVLYATREARDGALKTPMAEGMESGYARLDAVLGDIA